MKVCMLTSVFPRYEGDHCGAGRMIYETAKHLISNHKLEVSMVAPNYYKISKYDKMDGIEVFRFSYFWPRKYQRLAYDEGIPTNLRKYKLAKIQLPFFHINFLLRAFRIAKNADIIHIQWILLGLVGVPLGKLFRKPMLIYVHRVNPSGKWMERLVRYIVGKVAYVAFNSSYTRDELLKIAQPKRHCVIPCTVDPEKFNPDVPGKLRKKLGFPDDKLIILHVSYLVEKKGVQYLLNAMPMILKNVNNVHLVIGGGEGANLEAAKKQAKQLSIENDVTFLGWVKNDDLPSYYCDADVFVLPSIIDSKGETETLGIVLLEALACGTPVVGSNVGGIPDVINPEVGLLSEPQNSKDIADKLITLLSDDEKRKKMGQAAVHWAREKFSWESVSQKYMEIYNEIMMEDK